MRCLPLVVAVALTLGCGSENTEPVAGTGNEVSTADGAIDSAASSDIAGDASFQSDAAAALDNAETTGNGQDPADGAATTNTYACGWPKNDPGTLVATGTGVGDVVADWGAQDQCGERYRVWDGYGRYMLLISPVFW